MWLWRNDKTNLTNKHLSQTHRETFCLREANFVDANEQLCIHNRSTARRKTKDWREMSTTSQTTMADMNRDEWNYFLACNPAFVDHETTFLSFFLPPSPMCCLAQICTCLGMKSKRSLCHCLCCQKGFLKEKKSMTTSHHWEPNSIMGENKQNVQCSTQIPVQLIWFCFILMV